MLPRYILDHKKRLPNKKHPYIKFLFEIVFNGRSSWDTIVNEKISEEGMVVNKSVHKYCHKNMHSKLREIFRTSDIQKLRQPVKTEKDIITILRSIVKMYNYSCTSYYSAQKKTIYIITSN